MSWLDLLRDKSVSILIPIHNEAPALEQNVRLLLAEVAPFFRKRELIVLDDGSTDNSSEILERIQEPGLSVVKSATNQGKGHALREGLRHASGDYIFFIDGGMELHPKEIRVFLGLLLIYDADLIIGSKRHPQSEVYYPWYRRALSWIFQGVVNALFHLRVTDTQVGLKLMKAEVARSVLPDLHIDGYGFDLELLLKARAKGFTKVLEAPVRLDYFLKNKRGILAELRHVAKVALLITRDTFYLFLESRHR